VTKPKPTMALELASMTPCNTCCEDNVKITLSEAHACKRHTNMKKQTEYVARCFKLSQRVKT